jgi:hypothetical protein
MKSLEEVSMAKGDICVIISCNSVVRAGTKCDKHYRLWSKFQLLEYPPKKKLPDGVVKICSKHGNLSKEECYLQGKHREKYQYWYCKKCILDLNLKNNFGLKNGLDDYEIMLAAQDGKCAICKCTENNTKRKGKEKRFNVDHNHKTGLPRSILCSFCNSLLGYAQDSIETLKSAIAYLESHSAD